MSPAVEQTDWSQIVALYDQLLAVSPTPVVTLNRAIAVGEVHGPSPALALVDELDLDSYYAFHATRADLLRRLGRDDDAAAAYARAAAMAPTVARVSWPCGAPAHDEAPESSNDEVRVNAWLKSTFTPFVARCRRIWPPQQGKDPGLEWWSSTTPGA